MPILKPLGQGIQKLCSQRNFIGDCIAVYLSISFCTFWPLFPKNRTFCAPAHRRTETLGAQAHRARRTGAQAHRRTGAQAHITWCTGAQRLAHRGAQSLEHRAWSTKLGAQSLEHKAWSTEHGAQSMEHRAGSTEHRA